MASKTAKKRKNKERRRQKKILQRQQHQRVAEERYTVPSIPPISLPPTPSSSSTSSPSSSSPSSSLLPTISTTAETTLAKQSFDSSSTPFLFGSRKRDLENVNFVYPKDPNGKVKPYAFERKASSLSESSTEHSPFQCPVTPAPENHHGDFPNSLLSNETIDDILIAKKKNAAVNEFPTIVNASISAASETGIDRYGTLPVPEEDASRAVGRLSGLTVEQAIEDKVGCRPRQNSTDGELNLPQRGLCDERRVLESYRWKLPHVAQPRGFINMGNTCFLNSTLQCLLYLPSFAQSLLSLTCDKSNIPFRTSNGAELNNGKRITFILRSLFRQVLCSENPSSESQPVAPRGIVQVLPKLGSCGARNGYEFRPGRQEDAHEFLVHLLDAMNDGELRDAGINQHVAGWRDRLPLPRLDETTFVHRNFGGYFRSQVKCTSCGYRSNTYDPFLNLSLEVATKNCTSLADAVIAFTRMETLDEHNQWKCSGCKKKVCATKQLTVFRPPIALCIQLKRFVFKGFNFAGRMGNHSGQKITKPVSFPAQFKLPLSDSRSCAYLLTGLVIHVGESASSGHYMAYVKQPLNGKEQWFSVDDSYVATVSGQAVMQQKDAYILFYSRQEVKLEFPTPPLRSSMTAEQAKELGQNRARARAESIDRSRVDTSDGVLVSVPDTVACISLSELPSTAGTTATTIFHRSTFEEEESKCDNSLPAKSFTPSFQSSSRDSSATSRDNSAARMIPASNETTPNNNSDSGASNETLSTSDSSRSSDSDSDNDSKSMLGTKETGSTYSVTNADTTNVDSNLAVLTNPVDASALGLDAISKFGANTRTRIVADRGAGFGQVEVILGSRYNKSKAWKFATAVSQKGRDFGLCGNRKITRWVDTNDEAQSSYSTSTTYAAQHTLRANLERTELSKEKEQKRKEVADQWDGCLDKGKLKKVKYAVKNALPNGYLPGCTRDQFQELQERTVNNKLSVKSCAFSEQYNGSKKLLSTS